MFGAYFIGGFMSYNQRLPNFSEEEMLGTFTSERKPYRALIRIERITEKTAYIVIPGWDSSITIKLNLLRLQSEANFEIIPDLRFFAQVNKGAENSKNIYLHKFSLT